MRHWLRSRLTYANVTATLALFLVLSGGTAVALSGSNTVFSDDIVDNEVYSADVRNDTLSGGGLVSADVRNDTQTSPAGGLGAVDLKPGSVGTSEVAADSLSGGDINESSLGIVPNADQLDGIDSTAFAQNGSEVWHEVGTLPEPTWGTSPSACYWGNWDTGAPVHNSAGFLRDRFGFVHLKGLVDADDGATYNCDFSSFPRESRIFSLPAGYRPARRNVFATITNGALGRVNVDGPEVFAVLGPGAVSVQASEVNAKEWLSLDGISFRCAPSGADGCP
jgi:hypothetical protein